MILGTQGGSVNINEISCVECGREVHWSRRQGEEKSYRGREDGGGKGKQGEEAWER